MSFQRLTWVGLIIAFSIAVSSIYLFKREKISYNAEIRPIFNKKCIVCHGGVKKSGGFSLLFREEALAKAKSGKFAIIPHDASGSELMKRLKSHDVEERMPLEAEPLSNDEISKIERWINEGANWEDHWSYIKPDKSISPPKVSDKWVANDIDKFVLDKLNQEGLKHSPETDKTALLRRLSLDLIGLPPSIEETQAFLKDNSPNAYEKQVDRLLKSSHFGERWATMWLDLARYADSKGYEKDLDRSIWQYRDWVIRAFNEDMPFDQFTIQQLAGDLLPKSNSITAKEIENRLIATAFHRNTMANDEGGTNDEEFRNMALLDRVSTTWEVWQGTTMACVQCHSHPYDPFRHKEFYQSFAFFNNTQDRDLYNDKPLLKTYAVEKEQEVRKLLTWLKNVEKDAAPISPNIPLDKQRQDYLKKMGIYRIEAEEFDSASRHIELWNNQKTIMQTTDGAYTVYEDVDLTGVSQVTYGYQSGAENLFIEMRLGSSEGELISRVETKCSEETVNAGWSRWSRYTTSTGSVKPTKGLHDVYLVYKKGKNFWTDLIHLDWIDFQSKNPLKNSYPKSFRDSLDRLAKVESIGIPVLIEMNPNRARKTHVFIRGNWTAHGDEVKPAVPGSLPGMKNFPANRLGFAEWLVSKDNPLTARVMVNRFWEQLFGNGIVESLEDFGTMGAKPTHPELLDWLAVKFMEEQNWSVKKLLKLMVMSATYRQSEIVSKELLEKDPRNLFLARGPRVRLSSEQIRDQALFVSQLLNEEMYGPSVRPPNPTDDSWRNEPKKNLFRRAVYTYWRRTNPYPSMITFDSPQRNVCTSRRIRTNTPLQALTTLNDTVYYAAAQNIALKMKQVPSKRIEEKLKVGYEYLFQKAPSDDKTKLLYQLYQEALLDLSKKEKGEPELGALTLTANAMMNLDEFLTK
ncbi:DUF1553 domain-containing protein [Emticicia sp. BO119]|uniref:DUF1553 domain-containing protein n=1 Tax=Emticicia sp. BO119 TaxID=2757768 RepID=UPI0015F0262B|nr:DUF1553 domain-containing protein [Emticicia sp. BO119]MBA4849902.1 DUF1553 domain-containing protein [Emticicia sp. BO119]